MPWQLSRLYLNWLMYALTALFIARFVYLGKE